jgi:hypothetical protein
MDKTKYKDMMHIFKGAIAYNEQQVRCLSARTMVFPTNKRPIPFTVLILFFLVTGFLWNDRKLLLYFNLWIQSREWTTPNDKGGTLQSILKDGTERNYEIGPLPSDFIHRLPVEPWFPRHKNACRVEFVKKDMSLCTIRMSSQFRKRVDSK